jgi:tape measure domain-containing protein
MDSSNAGKVTWNLDLDTGKFDSKLAGSKSSVKGFGTVVDGVEGAVVGFGKQVAGFAWDAMKVGAATATTAITALGIKGVTSGNQLQTLQLSMNGLTHSMELGAQAMAGAYAYAQKAPFQLPDVAATTKTLIAYGMSAKDAVKSLDTLGNVSITTGVPIQALGGIFGQVSSQGKLMLGDIRQLTENGVAILPALQKEFGKTAADVQAMATAGEISFDQFSKALSSLVDPSILDQLNNTLPRQVDRLGGSIRILSNAFVGVGVDATNGFTVASDGIQTAVTGLVKNVANTLRSPELLQAAQQVGLSIAPVITNLSGLIQPLIGTVIAIVPPLVALIGNLSTLLQPLLAVVTTIAPPLVGMVSVIAAVLSSAFTALMPGLQAFFSAMVTGFGAIAPVVQQLGSLLGDTLGGIFQALAPAIAPIAQAFGIVAPVLVQIVGTLATFIAQLASELAPILPPIAKALADIVVPLVAGLMPIMPAIVSLVGALAGAFIQILAAIMPLVPPLIQVVSLVLQQILLPIMPLVVQLLQLFAGVITMVVNAITPLLPVLMPLVTTLVNALAPILPMLVKLFIQLTVALLPILPPILQLVTILLPPLVQLLTLVINVVSILSNAMSTVLVGALSIGISLIGSLIGWLAQVYMWFGNLAARVAAAATMILSSMNSAIGGTVAWFAALPGQVIGAIGYMGSLLYNAGRDLIQGLLNGASSLLKNIAKFFIDMLPGWIRDPFKKALGINSPSKVFAGYGRNLIEGLVGGIDQSQSLVTNAMSSLSDQVGLDTTMSIGTAQNASGAVIANSLASTAAAGKAPNTQPTVVHLHMDGIIAKSRGDFREIMKDGIESVNEELRARRLPQIANGLVAGSSTAA